MGLPWLDVIDKTKYPATWKFTHNKGYGGGWDVPCRVVKRGPRKVQIAALLANGSEKLVWVRPDKLVEFKGNDSRSAL